MTDLTDLSVSRVSVELILGMREEYRRVMASQIVHDSYHARGFTDSYLFQKGDQVVGYGSVAGDPQEPRETIKEVYVVPEHRTAAMALFQELIVASRARWIESQTNDTLLTLMLLEYAVEVESTKVLYRDEFTTHHAPPGVQMRRVTDQDRAAIFPHTSEPVGDWGLEFEGRIVGTGGLMFHYNPPYGDIYMEVSEPFRRRGYGSYLVQELKRLCYESGSVPAARANKGNIASRLTLERAGMLSNAHIIRGRIPSAVPSASRPA